MRYLLEPDDDCDPEREALDHGQRYELHRSSGADEREADQDEPCEHAHDEHAGGADVGHDREQHHRHRPGRPAHLQVAAAEDRSEDPGDDRRDEARSGTQA